MHNIAVLLDCSVLYADGISLSSLSRARSVSVSRNIGEGTGKAVRKTDEGSEYGQRHHSSLEGIYMNGYIYIYIYIYVRMCVCACIYMCINVYIYVYVYVHIYTYIYV